MRLTKPVVTLALLSAMGCGSDAPTAANNDLAPKYSVRVAGDRTGEQSGISLTTFVANGWAEEPSERTPGYASDVSLVLLASENPVAPQTNIGLLGKPKVGTYRVRVVGTGDRGALEYYGRYRITNADGTTTVYDATTGTVTITEVSSVIRGTFAFHCAFAATWPAQLVAGVSAKSTPASLDVSGAFVARNVDDAPRALAP